MIHFVGNAAIDMLIRVDRLPRPGETIIARDASEDLGGKGANQAVVAARCGAKARLVAAIGSDAAGERIRRSLEAEGVGTDGLNVGPGVTDQCIIHVDAVGENTIVSLVANALAFDPLADDALANAIAPNDWLVMQGNLRPEITRACLALAKRRGATTVLNPSPTYSSTEYDWPRVDIAILNRGEAVEIGGHDDPFEAARALLWAGARAIILTFGENGAAMLAARETRRVPAPRVSAIDTVGAGDVFCGALVAARASGRDWNAALRAGAGAAAICVQRRGVLASFPTRQEMAEILMEPRHGR